MCGKFKLHHQKDSECFPNMTRDLKSTHPGDCLQIKVEGACKQGTACFWLCVATVRRRMCPWSGDRRPGASGGGGGGGGAVGGGGGGGDSGDGLDGVPLLDLLAISAPPGGDGDLGDRPETVEPPCAVCMTDHFSKKIVFSSHKNLPHHTPSTFIPKT